MDPIKTLLKKVRETIAGFNMLDPGDRVMVAVSGGPDSVCLLDILHALREEWGLELIAAHFNHGLRPDEDDAETRFVRRLAESMSLPVEIGTASPLLNRAGISLEEGARDARYVFLEELRSKHHAQKTALGHNQNDQAETVIMRLLRGSGPAGLAGIPPCREPSVIRPLIEIRRREIEDYLDARGLTYVVDSSNLVPGFLRNQIRLELMPRLLQYQPRLIELLGRTADILRDENQYVEILTKDWVDRNASSGPAGEFSIPLKAFSGLPRAMRSRISRCLLEKAKGGLRRVNYAHIKAIDGLARGHRPQGILNLPGPLMVRRVYDSLVFSSEPEPAPGDFCYRLEGPGTLCMEEVGKTLSLEEVRGGFNPELQKDGHTAFFDGEKLTFPLTLRNFHAGDTFVPLGMTGHKKIKDFFIDRKIPARQRASTPIMLSGERTAWVCGHRIDDRFKVTPRTKKILRAALSGEKIPKQNSKYEIRHSDLKTE
ncbi:MAG: tRNA lysidine(34) synthetase TilS [Pseudomonadota bacterium]